MRFVHLVSMLNEAGRTAAGPGCGRSDPPLQNTRLCVLL